MAKPIVAGLLAALTASVWSLAAAQTPVDANGLNHLPVLTLPPSSFLSSEAKTAYIDQTRHPQVLDPIEAAPVAAKLRSSYDTLLKSAVDRAKAVYAVTIARNTMGGVPVEIVTPKEGVAAQHQDKVLINLHGGAFMVGGGSLGGELEAIPVASLRLQGGRCRL